MPARAFQPSSAYRVGLRLLPGYGLPARIKSSEVLLLPIVQHRTQPDRLPVRVDEDRLTESSGVELKLLEVHHSLL